MNSAGLQPAPPESVGAGADGLLTVSEETDQHIAALFHAGLSSYQIASRLDVRLGKTAVHNHLNTVGLGRTRSQARQLKCDQAHDAWKAKVVRGKCGVPGCTDAECEIEYGCCHGGCGETTPLATVSKHERSQVRGEPLQFARDHQRNNCPAQFLAATAGGEPLRQSRLAAGLSQRALAKKASVAPVEVRKLEGFSSFRIKRDRAHRVAAALGAEVGALFSEDLPEGPGECLRPPTPRGQQFCGNEAMAHFKAIWEKALAEVEKYCDAHGLMYQVKVVEFLACPAASVINASEEELPVKRKAFCGFEFVLYAELDVKRYGRVRLKKPNVRPWVNAEAVFDLAAAHGYDVPAVVERARARKAHGKNRAGKPQPSPISDKTAPRWAQMLAEEEAEVAGDEQNGRHRWDPEYERPSRLEQVKQVALRDYSEHPETWRREKWPPNSSDRDSLDPDYYKAAADRIRNALARLNPG